MNVAEKKNGKELTLKVDNTSACSMLPHTFGEGFPTDSNKYHFQYNQQNRMCIL